MAMLYRSMIEDVDGKPKVGRSARELGVRAGDKSPHNDVDAIQPDDIVLTTKGMSVAPNDPFNLQRHRRPQMYGGSAVEPLWVIDETDLGFELIFVQDSPRHGMIVPLNPMTFRDYETALASTRDNWRKV